LLEVKSNLPHEWIHPEHPDAAELAKKFAQRKKCVPFVMFELGKIKASSSAMASFVEGVLLIELIESGE
jgi:hypothetical protein